MTSTIAVGSVFRYFSPETVCSITLSSSSCGNVGWRTTSAINFTRSSVERERPDANTLVPDERIDPPINSIALSN